ncbi:FkbM family methyltransferase [Rhizobium sp. P38BS-XIX]|uniref:FkbM family methyltransferase n=1 Tax=Rhizobium sp. P38BS-XIX TaxID=2726740 RepID=UPI0014575CD6|nr:FkbM family methyltransferase [Rhizobium sp. P38BS-XIX]NLS00665.1 FkbM family methyltransferase [Rhizobium sp. P38BS-XIX]
MTLGQKTCYSHFGEDQIVSFLFGEQKTGGLYFDVGCYHPSLFSNTYFFYQRGWRGVLVDANPFMINLCRAERPEDTALNFAIGGENGMATLYKFNDWGSSNTIDPNFRDSIATGQNVQVTETVDVAMITLNSLFASYTNGQDIDFLNIDIENVDYVALSGNDWSLFRPKVIAIEDLGFRLNEPENSPIHTFLSARNYRMEARAVYTSIYVADEARSSLNV